MAHRDHESDGRERSDDPIISDSSRNPGVAMTRDGMDNESDTSLTLQRRGRKRLLYEMAGQDSSNQAVACPPTLWAPMRLVARSREFTLPRASSSSLKPAVGMTRDGVEDESDTTIRCLSLRTYGRNMLFPKRHDRHERKISMGTLEPPEDKRIKTLLVRGLIPGICEQDIRIQFRAFGEIESIRFLAEEGRALVTYTSREGAEKATQVLSNGLFINGHRLKLAWEKVLQSDQDSSNQAVACPPTLWAPMRLVARSREFTLPRASSSRMTRDGVENESDTTIRCLSLQTYGRNMLFPKRHDQMAAQNRDIHRHKLLRAELLEKASRGTLEPPQDKRINTLLARGLNTSISEQDIRVQFGAYGEIESIRFLAEEGRAFVTYTSRVGAEKATQVLLSNGLVINGQRLILAWAGPDFPNSDQDSSNQAVACPPSMCVPMKLIGRSSEFTLSCSRASSSSLDQMPPRQPSPP